MKVKKSILSLTMVVGLMLGSATGVFADTYQKQVSNLEKKFLKELNVEDTMEHIEELSEEIGPRIASTKEEYEGALYVAEEFEDLNYDVEIQEFKYTTWSGDEKTSWNVIATRKPETKENKVDKNDTDEIVHVTAHHDSVAKAPGANDNASGVAVMLGIAEAMEDLDIDKEVRFIACGAEEVGLKGSFAYVNSLTEEEKSRSIGNFNLDMVATAYEPCTELAVYTNDGHENVVTDAMKDAGEKLSYLSNDYVEYNGEFDGKMGSSDHVPFSNAGIPSSLFINVDPSKKDDPRSAIEPYYHKPEDHTGNVSEERLERTLKLTGIALINTLNVEK